MSFIFILSLGEHVPILQKRFEPLFTAIDEAHDSLIFRDDRAHPTAESTVTTGRRVFVDDERALIGICTSI